MRPLLVAIVVASTITGATEPPWKTTGACLTPGGTLCRTLEYDTTGWVNQGWGIHDVLRFRIHRIEAIADDGTAMIRESRQSYKYYVMPAEIYDRARIIIPPKRQTVEIEHTLKEFQDLRGLWRFNEHWVADTDCASMATRDWIEGGELDNGFRKSGRTVYVAGVPAIEYAREFGDRGRIVSERKALAPSLGCTEVSQIRSERNRMGLRTATLQSMLTSILLGAPRKELFVVPPSYREVRHYLEHDTRPEWPYLPQLSFFQGVSPR